MGVKERMTCWRLTILLGVVCAAACAPARAGRLKRPADMPPRDAMTLFFEAAQRPCADLARAHPNGGIVADLMVRGTSNGSRVSTRLWFGWDFDDGLLRLEPLEGAPPAFIFIANGLVDDKHDPEFDGTLVVRRSGGAIQSERSRELLYPLVGVPLSARELTSVIAGCTSFAGSMSGHTLGPDVVRLTFDGDLPAELLFRRDAGVPAGWTLLGMGRMMPGRTTHWRADYGRRVLAVFKDFRIRSREWNGTTPGPFDVSFSWRRIQVGVALDEQLFAPEAPSSRPVS